MLYNSNRLDKRSPKSKNCIISIDPGEAICGISIISNNYFQGLNIPNEFVIPKLNDFLANQQKQEVIAVIEDIRPYSTKISPQLMSTIQFIGELKYRLKNELQINFLLIPRSEVRKWIFDTFPNDCIDKIDNRIAYLDAYGEKKGGRRYRNKSGELRKASFNYVDDRIIISIMKKVWNIPTPKPGKSNIYGFTAHAWQALALATYYLESA